MIQVKNQYANAIVSSEAKDLQDIHLKSKNIAIYERNIDSLNKELAQLAERSIECRAKGTVTEILVSLENYFTDTLPNCTSLLEDITNIVKLFQETTHAASLRLLLASVSTNMCRRFHTDVNDIRLLCTYIGPGTLWLPDEAIDYKAVRKGGENQEIVKDPEQIQQVATGDVVLLKGGLYPDANPIMHRSPTIEKDGMKRLLLRIDTNEFLNFDF